MAKVTKERVAKICKRINEGMRPAYATHAEGLGGGYLVALKDSGIIYKDSQGNWKGMVKIHATRFDEFVKLRQRYDKQVKDGVISVKYTNKLPNDTPVVEKVSLFRRIWNSILKK
jgi:hypothetical protein